MSKTDDNSTEHGSGGGLVKDENGKVAKVAGTKPANGLPKLDADDAVYDDFLNYLREQQPEPIDKPIKLTPELKQEFEGLNVLIRDRAWSTYTLEHRVAAEKADTTGEDNETAQN